MKKEDESWYSDGKGRKLEQGDLVRLYIRYHNSQGEWLNRHFNVRNYYTVLLSALLGLYVGGIVQIEIAKINVLKGSMLYWILLVLPIASVLLSIIALFSTTRYYVGFLRMVVTAAKIENMLGLDHQVKTDEKPKALIWPKDVRFVFKQFWDSRKKFDCSDQFVKNRRCKGDNLWAILTFLSFLLINAVLQIMHLVVWF